MLPLWVISDTHIGAIRSAGTTPQTAYQLRQYLLKEFEELLKLTEGEPLLILGDLFDTGHIPLADMLATWVMLAKRCQTGAPLYLVPGNHDLEKTLTTLSSFQFLCKVLSESYPNCVQVIDQPCGDLDGVYVIPHVANQDLFDLALQAVPECQYLLVHCNYNNGFAVQSDHSLNMSMEQAIACKARHIVFAHEHQGKTALNGKVVIPGNPFPSSVADCLGNDAKRMARLTPEGVQFIGTWIADGQYVEQDWRALTDSGEKFIRVVGEATAAEAADVVSAISKFRNKASALVITNAVKVEGVADGEQIQVTLEQVKAFDVFEALLQCLNEEEQAIVKSLYAARQEQT